MYVNLSIMLFCVVLLLLLLLLLLFCVSLLVFRCFKEKEVLLQVSSIKDQFWEKMELRLSAPHIGSSAEEERVHYRTAAAF
jgi:hypothetical protein